MAFGEYRTHYPDAGTMLMLKLGTGVGAGIIAGGRIYRGADGAAGDIGHIQLLDPAPTRGAGLPVRQHRVRGGARRRLGDGPRPRAPRVATCTPWTTRSS